MIFDDVLDETVDSIQNRLANIALDKFDNCKNISVTIANTRKSWSKNGRETTYEIGYVKVNGKDINTLQYDCNERYIVITNIPIINTKYLIPAHIKNEYNIMFDADTDSETDEEDNGEH